MILSWRRKGSRFTDGGEIDILNISIISLVLFFNLTDQVFKYQSYFERIVFTLPFILIILFVLLFNKNKVMQSIIFLVIAIGTSLDPANISDYSGAIFFVYSFHLIKKKWYALLIFFLTIASVTTRSLINGDTIPQSFVLLSVFFYIYAIYYFLIFKASWKKKSPLSKEQMNIMRMVAVDGMSQKMIAAELGISQDKVFTEIKEIRELLTKEGDQTITKDQVIYIITKEYGFSDGK
jgi:predicted DNA-binding protein (UPF0251 family)